MQYRQAAALLCAGLAGAGLAGAGLLGLGAHAGEPEVWAALNDGRLVQSLDRDPGAAVAIYEAVLNHLPDDDPIRGDLLYWLGRASFEAGDLEEALTSLEAAARDPSVHDVARTLSGRIQLQRLVVPALPYLEDFDLGRGNWVRGWPRGQDDDLTTANLDTPGEAALAWTVDVREGEEDYVVLPLAPQRRPLQRVRLFMRSEVFGSHVRILLEDTSGRSWTAPLMELHTDHWTPVDIPLGAFVPAEAPASRQRPDGTAIRALLVKDVSAFHDVPRGNNVIYFDDVEIR